MSSEYFPVGTAVILHCQSDGTAHVIALETEGTIIGSLGLGGVIVRFKGYPGDGSTDRGYGCNTQELRALSPLELLARCADE